MKVKTLLISSIIFVNGLILTGKINKEIDRSLLNTSGYDSVMIQIVLDDFKLVKGLEYVYVQDHWVAGGNPGMTRYMKLIDSCYTGMAEAFFHGSTGKYDLIINHSDAHKGNPCVEITINDNIIGEVFLDTSDVANELIIRNINIVKWSKARIKISHYENESLLIKNLIFKYVGIYEGKLEAITKPITLKVLESEVEKKAGREMLNGFISKRINSLASIRRIEIENLEGPEDFYKWQAKARNNLINYLGQFPEKTPLNPRITGRLDHEDYSIEKVVFESQPDYYVPANLYIPQNRKLPVPGIILTCGHSANGKAQSLYQSLCIGLVLKGYVVLAFDPMGQGERSEYFNFETKKNIIPLTSAQHMYLGRTSYLVDWSLAGLRVWDGIRAVDYLISRQEVDADKIGIVGNSGGGQMALLITAADTRIKVCVAGHPGGPMESRYLKGYGLGSQSIIDKEILSLIPPRPCRIIIGRESGEENTHRPKIEDMQLFYNGLGFRNNVDLVFVEGIHDMKQPKREAAYEWFNRWFNKEEEGISEPYLQPEDERDLLCSESGLTLLSFGGETGQSLNVKRLDTIYKPIQEKAEQKRQIANRIGLDLNGSFKKPVTKVFESFIFDSINIEKFVYESEEGVMVPTILYKPESLNSSNYLYLFVSDRGKPSLLDESNIPYMLAKSGNISMSVDVRGTGETCPTPPVFFDQSEFSEENPPDVVSHYRLNWETETAAIQCLTFEQTLTGMRTLDIMKGIEYIKSRQDLRDRNVILIGYGSAGLWVSLVAIFNSDLSGIITLKSLPSLKLLITSKYYNVWDYFWMPGVLRDFDIPDLIRLNSPTTQLWIDPINATGEKLYRAEAEIITGTYDNYHIITTGTGADGNIVRIIQQYFHN